MRTALSSYALVGIEAVLVEVVVDRDRVRVVEPETGRVLHSVTLLDRTLPEGAVPEHVVNGRTLSQGRSAPADLRKDVADQRARIRRGAQARSSRVRPHERHPEIIGPVLRVPRPSGGPS